jgi:dolichol-phosphate mannosyltransferase
MSNKIELSVLLPAYREEENLSVLLPRLHNTLSTLTDRYEIVVVDTVSPLDRTNDVCKANKVIYVNRMGGDSFGDAVRTGIKTGKGDFILFMDADGSHPPEFIPSLFRHRNEHDVVIASRYVAGGHTENTKLQIFMSRALNLVYSLVLNIKCKDVSNSFRLYKAPLLQELELRCNNFDIVEEILYKICKNHKDVKIHEEPFSFKKRLYGKTKRNLAVFILTYVFTLLKLRFGR